MLEKMKSEINSIKLSRFTIKKWQTCNCYLKVAIYT